MKKLAELYVFVIANEDGDELIEVLTDGPKQLPLIANTLELVEEFKPAAQAAANKHGRQILIRRFQGGDEIGVIKPRVH